jgi:hypothetical protein
VVIERRNVDAARFYDSAPLAEHSRQLTVPAKDFRKETATRPDMENHSDGCRAVWRQCFAAATRLYLRYDGAIGNGTSACGLSGDDISRRGNRKPRSCWFWPRPKKVTRLAAPSGDRKTVRLALPPLPLAGMRRY